jgi:hypothetical protein
MQQSFLSRRGGIQAAVFVALGVALMTTGLSAVASDGVNDEPVLTPDVKPGKGRPIKWWLQIYSHTMQEEAFLQWMDQTHGTTAWRHTMQEAQVNAIWNWWCICIWNGGGGSGG